MLYTVLFGVFLILQSPVYSCQASSQGSRVGDGTNSSVRDEMQSALNGSVDLIVCHIRTYLTQYSYDVSSLNTHSVTVLSVM